MLVGPALGLIFGQPIGASFMLAAMLSTIALVWNYVFNSFFEAWESRQPDRERTFRRRLLHSAGFEFGLVFLLVPTMAWWLETSLLTAFIADLGLLVFFFFYSIVFTWLFDLVFGLPASTATKSGRAGD